MLDGLSCSGSSETRTATSENACLFAQLAERCSRQLPRGQLSPRPRQASLATGSRLPRSYRRRRYAYSVVVDHDSDPRDDVVRRPRLDLVAVAHEGVRSDEPHVTIEVCGSAISTSKPGLCRRIERAIDCPYISGEFATSTLKINAFLSAQTKAAMGNARRGRLPDRVSSLDYLTPARSRPGQFAGLRKEDGPNRLCGCI